MQQPLKILLTGIGGYGAYHAGEVLANMHRENVIIGGAVDPKPEQSKLYADLKKAGIPFYESLEEYYAADRADLAIIASPIQFHRHQACTAMRNGSHVLCEKPLGGCVEDGLTMIKVRNETQKILAIGYQWSFSKAVQDLKKDIHSGRFGNPKRMKTLVRWPRGIAYYGRNSWAGRLKDSQGNWIRDSIANNATAHHLHNMFFLLGDAPDTSDMPKTVQAELYRANSIETFDTVAVRVITRKNTELLFYASHAIRKSNLDIRLEFEKATIEYHAPDGKFVAYFNNGTVCDYGSPDMTPMKKIWDTVNAVRGQGTIACGPEAALAQMICIEAMHSSMEPASFPEDLVRFDESLQQFWVDGLYEGLLHCYENGILPYEGKLRWAREGTMVSGEPVLLSHFL